MRLALSADQPDLELAERNLAVSAVDVRVHTGARLEFKYITDWIQRPDAGEGGVEVLDHRRRGELQYLAQSSFVRQRAVYMRIKLGQNDALVQRPISPREFRIGFLELADQGLAVLLHHLQLIGLSALLGPARSCFHRFVKSFDNHFRHGRFTHESVGANIQRHLFVRWRRKSRAVSDERNRSQCRVFANFIAQAVAVHVGHKNVGDHGVDFVVLKRLECRKPVCAFDHRVALFNEQKPQVLAV